MKVVEDAFQSQGWLSGDWDEFYNELVCEKDARDASDPREVDDTAMELHRGATESMFKVLTSAAIEARARIRDALEVQFRRPVMITVFLPDAAVDFIAGSYGYVSHKTTLDKICIPHRCVLAYPVAFDTLAHEFSHVATFELGGHEVPGWLDEGLAMCLCGEVGKSNDPQIAALASKYPRLLSISRIEGALESRDLRKDDPMRVDAAYVLAGSLVAWWLENHGIDSVKTALARFLEDDNDDHAVHRAIGISRGELENEWHDSLGL